MVYLFIKGVHFYKYNALGAANIKVDAIIDDSAINKNLFPKKKVIRPEELLKRGGFVVISSTKYADEIRTTLLQNGMEEYRNFITWDDFREKCALKSSAYVY